MVFFAVWIGVFSQRKERGGGRGKRHKRFARHHEGGFPVHSSKVRKERIGRLFFNGFFWGESVGMKIGKIAAGVCALSVQA